MNSGYFVYSKNGLFMTYIKNVFVPLTARPYRVDTGRIFKKRQNFFAPSPARTQRTHCQNFYYICIFPKQNAMSVYRIPIKFLTYLQDYDS